MAADVRFCVLSGGPAPALLPLSDTRKDSIHVRSLHIMGVEDEAVPMADSRALASLFVEPCIHVHPRVRVGP